MIVTALAERIAALPSVRSEIGSRPLSLLQSHRGDGRRERLHILAFVHGANVPQYFISGYSIPLAHGQRPIEEVFERIMSFRESLRGSPTLSAMPEPFGLVRLGDWTYLVERFLPWKRWVPERTRVRLSRRQRDYLEVTMSWLEEFQHKTRASSGRAYTCAEVGESFKLELDVFVEHGLPNEWVEIGQKVVSILKRNKCGRFEKCGVHGDFASVNVRAPRDKARFVIVDWEYSEREGWPFFDPLFNIAALFLRERNTGRSALSFERFLHKEDSSLGARPRKYVEVLQKSSVCSEGVIRGLTAWVVLIAVARKYMLELPGTGWQEMLGDMRKLIAGH